MQALALYLIMAVIFLALDAVMLSRVIGPLFATHLGDMLRDELRLVPAMLFYLVYVAGLLWFVAWPAWRAEAALAALGNGALFGLIAYGTYEMTNFATLRGWHWQMAATDMAWGAVLTGVTAWAGVAILLALN